MPLANNNKEKTIFNPNAINTQNSFSLALKYFQQGAFENAENLLKQVLKGDPANHQACYYLGLIAFNYKNYSDAAQLLEIAAAICPHYTYFLSLGNVSYCLNDYDKALEYYQKALELNQNAPEIYNNIGSTLEKLDRDDEALEYYNIVLKKYPKFADVYCNLGVIFNKKGQHDEAIRYYMKSLKAKPNDVTTLTNIGGAYRSQRDIPNAIKWYEKALKADPGNAETKLNLGLTFLLNKDFQKGWKYYEHRFTGYKEPAPDTEKKRPKWNGNSLENKVIYVLHEQGIGDTFQFVRYFRYFDAYKPKKILFKTQKGTEDLLRSSAIGAEIVDSSVNDDSLEFDTYIPLMSLPYYLKRDVVGLPDKYLKTDYNKVCAYKERFFQTDKYKIGLCWQGSPGHKGDKLRSLPLSLFYPLLGLPNTQFYSLQVGFGSEQLENLPDKAKITNLALSISDFSDTAAAIENLDLLITIDSSVAHLAGALGKKTWIILPTNLEWRWFLDEDKTVWYESARLFRPKLGQDKSEVISRIYRNLTEIL